MISFLNIFSKAEEDGQFLWYDFLQGFITSLISGLGFAVGYVLRDISGKDNISSNILIVITLVVNYYWVYYYWSKRPGISYGILTGFVFLIPVTLIAIFS